jgi:hypothetical protein
MHELNAEAIKAYHCLYEDVASDDEDGRAAIWQPIQDFWQEHMAGDTGASKSMRSVVSQMLSAKEQFADLVSSWSTWQ